MREPRDGVALAASCGVLDEVAPSGTMLAGVSEQLAHGVELVVPGPDLGLPLPACLLLLGLHHLRVVLEDVCEAPPGEHLAPEVVCLQAVWIGWVSGAVVPPAVEGEEPGRLALQVRAELDLVLVHGEVGHAPPEFEELLAWVAVSLVLLDGVAHCLLGKGVLELEGEDGEAVDEEPDVEGPLALVAAVAKLPRYREAVLLEALLRLLVPFRGRSVEKVEIKGLVPDPVAQDVDGAALGDFPLEACEELPARRAVVGQCERFCSLGLGRLKECLELNKVDAVLAVVVLVVARGPADASVA